MTGRLEKSSSSDVHSESEEHGNQFRIRVLFTYDLGHNETLRKAGPVLGREVVARSGSSSSTSSTITGFEFAASSKFLEVATTAASTSSRTALTRDTDDGEDMADCAEDMGRYKEALNRQISPYGFGSMIWDKCTRAYQLP